MRPQLYGIDLSFVSIFFRIAAGIELCAAAVVDCSGEASGVRIPERDQAMLRSERHQISRLSVKHVVQQNAGL